MIRTLSFTFLISVVTVITPWLATAQAVENKTVTLDVPGMTCQFCPITIRKSLEKVPGVIDAKADYDSKTATITFNPNKTNVEALTKATAEAGYPSSLKTN